MALSDGRACKKYFLGEIPRKITGVLYEQNKSNETIQRHSSDEAVQPMHMVDILIIRLYIMVPTMG